MSRQSWPQAYAPLRPGTLLWQLAVLVLVEVLLYSSYATHSARFHWATHFLVGLVAASLWWTAFLLVTARPSRFQLLSILGFHLWAMWPDLVFRTGLPHYRWMDWVALGHVSSHYLPGGDTSWLALALGAAGLYAAVLWRWLAARHAEAAAGLAPALGVGGTAVLRPQLDPREHVLRHDRLGPCPPPPGAEPLLLLHGLGATSSTWLPTARRMAAAGHPVLVPDLLGFGSSMRLGTTYGLDAQADAVLRLLDHADVARAHLVGHSWGAVVAAAVTARAPGRVSGLTLVAPAVFADVEAAQARFAARSWLARSTLSGSALAGLACGVMCLGRPLFARLAPRLEPDVPEQVARDGVQHSFPAYADALASMWHDNPVVDVLRSPPCPVTVVLAEQDETVLPADVLALDPSPDVRVLRVTGDHGIAYTSPDLVADLLQAQLAATPGPQPPGGGP